MPLRIWRYIGLSYPESEYGDEADNKIYVDPQSVTLDTPADALIEYEGGLSGRARRMVVPGYYHPSGDLVFVPGLDSLLWGFRFALDDYSFVVGTPNVHTMRGKGGSELDSFTARIAKDILDPGEITPALWEHKFVGCVVDTLTLEVGEAMAQMTMSVQAQKDSQDDLAAETTVMDNLAQEPFLNFVGIKFELGTTDISARVSSLNLEIANSLDPAAGRGLCSRFPRRMIAGARNINISLSLYFDTLSELKKFWGNSNAKGPQPGGPTEQSCEITIAGANGKEATITIPNSVIHTVNLQPSGRTRMEQTVEIWALYDESEETDIEVEIKNDVDELVPQP